MSKKSHRRKLWKTQLICKAFLNYSQAIGLLSTLEFAVFLTQKTVAYEYNCTFFQIFPLLRFISLYLDLPKPVAEVDTMFNKSFITNYLFFPTIIRISPLHYKISWFILWVEENSHNRTSQNLGFFGFVLYNKWNFFSSISLPVKILG